MGRRQSEDVVANIAAAEVQGDGALVVGFIERGIATPSVDAKGWPNSVTTPSTRRLRDECLVPPEFCSLLADGDVDVGEAGLVDDGVLDVVGRGVGLLEDDSPGRHTDGQKERALAQPMAVMAVNPR